MYRSQIGDKLYEFNTSGLIYRSNKLFYDKETKSLWTMLSGQPVVGELADSDIKLETVHTVATNWKSWRKQFPDTTVLSIDTGHSRNYGEGVRYDEYRKSDVILYDLPKTTDPVLKIKDEVLALRSGKEQLAISVDFLKENSVYHDTFDDQKIVVLTDSNGANRVFECGDVCIESWNAKLNTAQDSDGHQWSVVETGLKRGGDQLNLLPAHRVFWFGWHAQFPTTRVVR